MSWRESLRVVLVRPRNPLNIGAAARAMLNFGFRDLRVVDPWTPSFRAAKSAMGGAEVLRGAAVEPSLAEALGGASLVVGTCSMTGRNSEIVCKTLPSAAASLRTHLDDRQAALVFGPEKTGLSSDDLAHCDWILTIPTEPGCPSMNLGQAVSVCCYELARRAAPAASLRTPASASAAERDRILGLLANVLRRSGYMRIEGEEKHLRKLRRWVTRLRLAPADAALFQGMLRQVEWRLDRDDAGPGDSADPE
jgi:TrmH family RNA methyltransferase